MIRSGIALIGAGVLAAGGVVVYSCRIERPRIREGSYFECYAPEEDPRFVALPELPGVHYRYAGEAGSRRFAEAVQRGAYDFTRDGVPDALMVCLSKGAVRVLLVPNAQQPRVTGGKREPPPAEPRYQLLALSGLSNALDAEVRLEGTDRLPNLLVKQEGRVMVYTSR